ncbi:MAG: NUDIX hydrolase [Actinobacteria bacterium]|nr:NUDIX hydrolase [Actinomycetota bacterium]
MDWGTRVTVEALVECDDRLLMVRHVRDGVVRWEVPGGYVEAGETLEQATAREVVEETGAVVTVGALAAVRVMEAAFRSRRSLSSIFRARLRLASARLTPQVSEGVVAVDWVVPTELDVGDIHPIHRPLVTEWWPHRGARATPLFYLADQVLDAEGRRTAVLR